MQNRQYLLASRPVGAPTKDNWTLSTSETPALADNQILVRIDYISLDPAMRGWMNDGKSYIEPVQIGEVMRAGTVGEVIESSDPNFSACSAGKASATTKESKLILERL